MRNNPLPTTILRARYNSLDIRVAAFPGLFMIARSIFSTATLCRDWPADPQASQEQSHAPLPIFSKIPMAVENDLGEGSG